MRLPTKTGYALRALFDMAFYGRGERVQAKEIAERQGIPLRYLEEVLQDLRRAGLVRAIRGPRGGYVLARASEEITVGDVMRALGGLGGDWFNAEPAEASDAEVPAARAPRPDIPALLGRELGQRLEAVLDGVTLEDYLRRADAEGLAAAPARALMYFI